MSKNSHVAFIDPVGRGISNPVIISHPRFAPYVYERSSVEEAYRNGELKHFFPDTRENQLREILLRPHFVVAILEYINKNINLPDEKNELADLYHTPINYQLPNKKNAYLCRQDGQTYVLSEIKNLLKDRQSSPFTGRAFTSDDFSFDSIAMHLLEKYELGERELRNIFNSWHQDKQKLIIGLKEFEKFKDRILYLLFPSLSIFCMLAYLYFLILKENFAKSTTVDIALSLIAMIEAIRKNYVITFRYENIEKMSRVMAVLLILVVFYILFNLYRENNSSAVLFYYLRFFIKIYELATLSSLPFHCRSLLNQVKNVLKNFHAFSRNAQFSILAIIPLIAILINKGFSYDASNLEVQLNTLLLSYFNLKNVPTIMSFGIPAMGNMVSRKEGQSLSLLKKLWIMVVVIATFFQVFNHSGDLGFAFSMACLAALLTYGSDPDILLSSAKIGRNLYRLQMSPAGKIEPVPLDSSLFKLNY